MLEARISLALHWLTSPSWWCSSPVWWVKSIWFGEEQAKKENSDCWLWRWWAFALHVHVSRYTILFWYRVSPVDFPSCLVSGTFHQCLLWRRIHHEINQRNLVLTFWSWISLSYLTSLVSHWFLIPHVFSKKNS